MLNVASRYYEVLIEPPSRRSLWKRLFFSGVNVTADLAAETVAADSEALGGPRAIAGYKICIREISTGKEVRRIDSKELSGATTPEHFLDDVQTDLNNMPVDRFRPKWGISPSEGSS